VKKAKNEDIYTIKRAFGEMITNRNFILLFLCVNFVNGIYSALPSMLSKLCVPFNNDQSLGGYFAITFLLMGILTSIPIGIVLDKFQNYKQMTILLCTTTCFFSLFTLYAMHIKDVFVMFVSLGFFGASIIPMMSVALPFGVELTWPVPEAYNNGLLMTLALFWGTILSFLVTSVSNLIAFSFFAVCALIGIICACFIENDLRRLNLEEVKQSAYEEEDKIKQMSVLERASILHQSQVIDQQDVRFKFAVSEHKYQEFSRITQLRISQQSQMSKSRYGQS
jgi:hypothetical protein